MSFVADKQTLNDLNLTGKYKGDSIYNLFDKTHTRGGGQLLDQMFQHPLTNAGAINTRTSVFRYFQHKEIVFPVTREQCEEVEQYISVAETNSRLGSAMVIGRKKILQTMGASIEYNTVQAGVLAVIKWLQTLHTFFASVEQCGNNPYSATIKEVQQLLNTGELNKLVKEQGHTVKLPVNKVISYDRLIRGTHREAVIRIMQVLYEIDVYITVSAIARERKFTWAQAHPFEEGRNQVAMTNVFHPRLTGAVTNSVHTNSRCNMIFLTGANMAGKSTFMKSFGIAIYLAHMGFPIAAESMEFSVQDGIYTSINVADNLDQGYSHFYAEVLRVKEVATAVSKGKNLVVIFDELFKGTNVKDAFDATVAVAEAFAENRNVTFIVSTHIVEAAEPLQAHCNNLHFVFFPTIMKKSVPHYTYKLQEGISNDRHGMMIITNEGILDIIKGR